MVFFRTVAALQFLLLIAGCATHESETRVMRTQWEAGDFKAANLAAQSSADRKNGSGDAIIWLLESGAAARAAGDIDASIAAFEKAQEKMKIYEDRPEISLTDETGAILTNQSYLPYRGYHYDKIMMCAYQAMNHMEKRDFEGSAVQLRRLRNYQENAARVNAARIERSAKEIEKSNQGKNSYDLDKALENPTLRSQLQRVYGDAYMPDKRLQARGVYTNPFAYWLAGIYFLHASETPSDINTAADLLRFAFEASGGQSAAILEDIKLAEKLAGASQASYPPLTYIIYETGSAPIRRQVRIDLPLFVVSNEVPYVGAAFPYLEMRNSYSPTLSISAGGLQPKLEEIADMDKIIKAEFDTELPEVVAKTLISTGVKAGIQYGIYQGARASDNDAAKIISILAGTIYQSAMNDADLRTWTTLPKRIKIARVPTPENGLVVLDSLHVSVAPLKNNIIFAKRAGANSKLDARVFTFN